jgi:hypothetical protein
LTRLYRILSRHIPTPPLAPSLGDNKIGDQGASALAAILKETQITNLGCAAARVFAFLSMPADHACSLTIPTRARSLSWNKLGPDGGAAIAEGLKGNSMLQSLEYATRARTRPRECLLLRQRPLTRKQTLCGSPSSL